MGLDDGKGLDCEEEEVACEEQKIENGESEHSDRPHFLTRTSARVP